MKKGISIWSFPDAPLQDSFQLAKRCGFEGVEVALGTEECEINLHSTQEEMLRIKAQADEAGIALYSVASGLYWSFSPTAGDPAIREKAKEITKKQLDIASWLGCDTILVVPGAVGIDFRPNSEVVPYDVAYDRALAFVRELAPYAEKKRVAIALENVWNKLFLSPLEMRGFIDKIGSDYVGAYFDVGNILPYGYPEHWIRILGDRIKKVHLKDYKRSYHGFVDLLEGDVNYPEVMKALAEIGYDDWLSPEMNVYPQYPEALLQATSLAMDKLMGNRRG